jgi:hypothetical protein
LRAQLGGSIGRKNKKAKNYRNRDAEGQQHPHTLIKITRADKTTPFRESNAAFDNGLLRR